MSDPLDDKFSEPAEHGSALEQEGPQKDDVINTEDTDSVRYSSKQRRLHYFRNGIFTDCEVHVCADTDIQSGSVCYKKFPCHRIFLATASDKLEQDIYQSKEWNGVLQINGVSPKSVEIFLEFIYTFDVISSNVELQFIGDIFILSCAYNMPELMVKFSNHLKDKEWPLDGIFPAFDLAFRHNISELEHACLGKILDNATELMKQPSIMKLQIYALNYVIQLWLVTEALSPEQLVHLLQEYQAVNDINFSNSQKFPHFTKIMQYFPNVLFDAEGLITKY